MTLEPIQVGQMSPAEREDVLTLVTGLPEHFDEDAIARAIPIDIAHQQCLVARVEGHVVGFVTLYVAEGRLHIGWLGVWPERQRQGIGSALIRAAEDRAKALGITELATYTLGESVDYAPYVSTRRFYEAMGFTPVCRKRTDRPSCPEELHLVKRVDVP